MTGFTTPTEACDDEVNTNVCQTMVLTSDFNEDNEDNVINDNNNECRSEGLTKAIETVLQGNRPLARYQLDEILQSEPENAEAWLWFAWVADSPEATTSALERAQTLGLNSPIIESGLAWAHGLTNWGNDNQPREDSQPQQETTNTQIIETEDSTDFEVTSDTIVREEALENDPGVDFKEINDNLDALVAEIPTNAEDLSPAPNVTATLVQSDFDAINGENNSDVELTVNVEAVANEIEGDPSEEASIVDEPVDEPAKADITDESETTVENPHAPTILAVDDSPTIRGLVKMCLEKSGYNVLTADDGMAALEPLKTQLPDLILLDINMPKLNGYQLCKLLKQDSRTSSIPVIMLSGKDGVFDKFRGKMSGCNDYLTKPFEARELQDKVAEYVSVSSES